MKKEELKKCKNCGRQSEVVDLEDVCPFCRGEALTSLSEELQKPCPRCRQPWIRHDCPSQYSEDI